jgi:glycerophosphoryl diester phosphodiesterase
MTRIGPADLLHGTLHAPSPAQAEDPRPAPTATDVFGGGPAVIGHRGLGCGVVAGHRENTLGSFTAAARLGMRWVEADVRRTGDDTLVVAHDAAYPDGACFTDLSAAEADQRGTLRLSTLLDTLPAGVGVNMDLKSSLEDCLRPPSRTTAGLLGPVASAETTRRPVMVSSFDPAALGRLRDEAPQVPLGWLTWHGFPLEMAVAGCAHMDVDVLALHVGSLGGDPRSGTVDASVVARAVSLVHGSGRQLLVWCPEARSTRMLVDAGADAVVVDQVPRALGALGLSA